MSAGLGGVLGAPARPPREAEPRGSRTLKLASGLRFR